MPKEPQSRERLSRLPTVVGVLANHAAERVVKDGRDPRPLLERAGLPTSLLDDPRIQIPVRRQIVFFNLVADALQDPLLGFHLALDFDVRELGPFYYVMASSGTLGEAFAREERYCSVVNEGLRVRCRRAGALTIDYHSSGVERHLDRHQMEFWVTCTLRDCRHLTERELVPTHVCFVHQPPGEAAEMTRYFGCEVSFGADQDRLVFNEQAADLPLISADPYLNRFLEEHHEKVIARRNKAPDPLRTRIENLIAPRLPHEVITINTIARELGMSARTLSRRLAEEGLTFSAILEELRAGLADRYLEEKDLSISQVAWLLGYTEPSSLVRAVRRRTGKPPREVRRQLDSSGGA